MTNWFECKVKYTRIDERGKEKKVTESYMLDAVSFTEAEARITENLEQCISGEFLVSAINRSNVTEICFSEDGDKWFKAKVTFMDMDADSGKEKAINDYVLIEADTVDDAYKKMEEYFSSVLIPYKIPSVSESPILEVFPYLNNK